MSRQQRYLSKASCAGCERDPAALQAIFDCLAGTFKALLRPLAAKLPEVVSAPLATAPSLHSFVA